MFSASGQTDQATSTPPEASPPDSLDSSAGIEPTEIAAAPQAPTGSAAPAASPFDSVPAPLRAALVRKGFSQLTTVQTAALAANDGERDLQISSQTGSGKTVALGFVLAQRLIANPPSAANPPSGPSTLIIAPTRELAVQVRDELGWLSADLRGVKRDCGTGGTHGGA